jgi:hypothetical protein
LGELGRVGHAELDEHAKRPPRGELRGVTDPGLPFLARGRFAHQRYEVPPEVDEALPLDWLGELAGDWRVLPELLELLDELEEEPDEPEPDEEEPDEPVLVPVLDDVPESLVEACVAPGSTSNTAPATATLAKDAVTVVPVSRRRPCSRSATARASCRALS